MKTIEEICQGLPVMSLREGEILLEEGRENKALLFLLEGEVEITREGEALAKVSEPGTVLGEVGLLLGRPHMATVRAVRPSKFRVADDGLGFLSENPEAQRHVARLLARRLTSVTSYLVEARKAGEEAELKMIQTIEDLIHSGKLPDNYRAEPQPRA